MAARQVRPDGSFQIAAQPGPGYLVVLGPSDDYVLREIDEGVVLQGKPGGRLYYAHAFIACDVKPASESLDVNVMLRPAMTVTGQVVGPDGQPIQDAWMVSLACPHSLGVRLGSCGTRITTAA